MKLQGETGSAIGHTLLLLLAAFVWGMAFPFQRIGAGYVGGWTFLMARAWLSVIVMLPVVLIQERRDRKVSANDTAEKAHSSHSGNRKSDKDGRNMKEAGTGIGPGILCGIFLCLASGFQQLGIAGTSTAKSGFITALYVVLVPILSRIILKKRQSGKIWLCIVLCVAGLYMLCFAGADGGSGADEAAVTGFSYGDFLTLICAFLFAGQIMLVSRYVKQVGALRLTFQQFVTEAVLATVLMFLFEKPSLSGLQSAWIPIAYAGIMSSAVGYSLQAIGQKGLNPAVASLAMCMESVFSAVGGWLLLHESLNAAEAIGCALMFAAILLTELPVEKIVLPHHR